MMPEFWQVLSRCRKGRLVVAAALAALLAVPATAAASQASVRNRAREHLLPVGDLPRAHLAARGPADEPDEPGRQDHHGGGPRHLQSLRVLHAGHPGAVHPGGRARGRAGRGRRRADRRHPAAGRRGAGGDLGPVAGRAVRPGDRGRGVRQGGQRQPRPDREHRPGPALGPVVRGAERGPVPERRARRARDRRGAGPGRGVPGEAPRGVQPGDVPEHARRQRRSSTPGPSTRSTCRRSTRR